MVRASLSPTWPAPTAATGSCALLDFGRLNIIGTAVSHRRRDDRAVASGRAVQACAVMIEPGAPRRVVVIRMRRSEASAQFRFVVCAHSKCLASSCAHTRKGSISRKERGEGSEHGVGGGGRSEHLRKLTRSPCVFPFGNLLRQCSMPRPCNSVPPHSCCGTQWAGG